MEINWDAVLTGFIVTVALAVVVSLLVPITTTSVWLLALPGLVGGFVAGYMGMGVRDGAVNGGLATIIGALFWLLVATLWGAAFVGIIPALAGATVALIALFVQAIPGAVAGAVGGWWHGRRAQPESAVTTG